MTNIHQYLHYMQCADTTGCVSVLCVVLLLQGVSKWGRQDACRRMWQSHNGHLSESGATLV